MNNSVIVIDSDSDDETSNSSSNTITKKSTSPSVSTSVNTTSVSKHETSIPTTSSTSLLLKNNNKKAINPTNKIQLDDENSTEKFDENVAAKKRKLSASSSDASSGVTGSIVTFTAQNEKKPRKRIQPTLVSREIDKESWYNVESPIIALDDMDDLTVTSEFPKSPLLQIPSANNSPKPPFIECINSPSTSEQASPSDKTATTSATANSLDKSDKKSKENDENSASIPFKILLKVCREADPSEDMNVLIKKKLLKYYFSAHPDFVVSKGFSKTVKVVTEEIKAQPDLVYLKLKTIVEELKIRKANNGGVMSNEEITTTGSKKRDEQVRRLNRSLHQLTKHIETLEKQECDLDEIMSSYIKLERYKKRACEIYEKICDLTGESKHAHRSVKKPIKFNGTDYPEFNRTIQQFVNRTKTFPDFYDVLQCLDHCNKQYGFGLRNDDLRRIAQDAFEKIGKLLQNRRKSDLYETAVHFTGTNTDPALEDPELNAKLLENQKHHSKISLIIDKFAAQQDAKGSEDVTEVNENNDDDKKLPLNENTLEHKNKNSVITETQKIIKTDNNQEKPNGMHVNVENKNKIKNKVEDDDDTNSNHSNSNCKSNNSSIKNNSNNKNSDNVNNNDVKNDNSSKNLLKTNSISPLQTLSPSSMTTTTTTISSLITSAQTTAAISTGKNFENKSNSSKTPYSILIKNPTSTSESKSPKITSTTTTTTISNSVKTIKNNTNSFIPTSNPSPINKIEEIVISDEDDS